MSPLGFRVASVADPYGDEKAVEWTRQALENPELMKSIADGTRRATAGRTESD